MDVFGRLACALCGHDWRYMATYRVCAYCGKLEKTA